MPNNIDQNAIIEYLSERHNVAIASDSHGNLLCNPTGELDTVYGWLPVPCAWIKAARKALK